MSNGQLPEFLQKLLDNPPTAGSGVHDYMFQVARNLHAHMPPGQIEALLRSKLANCGRPVPERELKAAVQNSLDYAWEPKDGKSTSAVAYRPLAINPSGVSAHAIPPKPKPDLEKIEKLVNEGVGVADLWEASPLWFEDRHTEDFIDWLFPGDPLLCCGETAFKFHTLPRSLWRDQLQSMSFIVPSAMSAVMGKVKDGSGRESEHTLDNTGPRCFIVVEFDFSEYGRDGTTPTQWQPMLQRLKKQNLSVQDLCANLLLRLNRAIPMTMAVSSGGKSIHGWWYCLGQDEAHVSKFHDYAITLGADPATRLKSQFVRMPDGTRDGGKEQPVLYFNRSTLPTPL